MPEADEQYALAAKYSSKLDIFRSFFRTFAKNNAKTAIMIYNERDMRHQQVIDAAKQMMTAARTAPKARGCDIIEIFLVVEDDIYALSNALRQIGEERQRAGMIRDAENILSADAILLIGSRSQAMGLNCAYCGSDTCESRGEGVPCTMNTIDVGIAIGSACATAADLRVDTRVMYSAGYAAHKLGWLPDCNYVIAIPVSASSKNPFFDRK